MGKEETVEKVELSKEEMNMLVDIGKIVFPGAIINAHETKNRIIHNLKFKEQHNVHTTSFSDNRYSCDWWVFLSEFVLKKLPQSFADEFVGTNVSEPIYFLTEKLGL